MALIPFHAVGVALFPRSSERGPVEAESDNSLKCFLSAMNFRAHLSAAPLKPLPPGSCGAVGAAYFRAHLSAAPLKLGIEPVGVQDRGVISALE